MPQWVDVTSQRCACLSDGGYVVNLLPYKLTSDKVCILRVCGAPLNSDKRAMT